VKFRARIVTAVASIIAAVCSVFVAAPALAHGDEEKIDTLAPFSHAGEPENWIAIAIVMVVLLVVVLGTSGWLSSLFEKKDS
jgi:hypothetical protein